MESIFFEKQEGQLCAQHALNALLQGAYFTAVDLADIAHRLDETEWDMLRAGGNSDAQQALQTPSQSQNMDDSGFFSVQVVQEALRVWNLDLTPFNSQRAAAERDNPTAAKAFVCNHREHWFTIRKFGIQWFNLNSLLTGPDLISDTYLHLFLTQLQSEGYSIFVVMGQVSESPADLLLTACPVDPALAAQQRHTVSDSEEDELAKAIRLSLQQQSTSTQTSAHQINVQSPLDDSMEAALQVSREHADGQDPTLSRVLGVSLADEEEQQLQRALALSMLGGAGMATETPPPSPAVPSPAAGVDPAVSAAEVRNRRQLFLARLEQQQRTTEASDETPTTENASS